MPTETDKAGKCQPAQATNTARAKSTPQVSSDDEEKLLLQIAAQIERERARLQKELKTEGADAFADRIRKMAQQGLEELENETPENRLARQRAEEERHRATEQRRLHEQRGGRWRELIQERGERYESCRLTNYEIGCPKQQKVLDELQRYGDAIHERASSGEGLLLIGPSGTGKDHLLVGLARVAIGADLRVSWASGPKLFSEVRRAIGNEYQSPGSVLRPYEQAQILLLSDLVPPSGKLTDFQAEIVYRLVDERYNRLLPTWMAANVKDRAELESGLGVPVVDRLVHGATVLPCDWQSYRRASGSQPTSV